MKPWSYLIIILLMFSGKLMAQNLSFSAPIDFLPDAKTDKAIDITPYKGGFFVAWKDVGATGNMHVSYLGKQYETRFSQHEEPLTNAQSAFAPVFSHLNGRIYLSWIAPDGTFKYIINATDTSFNTQKIYTANLSGKLSSGATSVALGKKLLVTSHAANKTDMVYALFDMNPDGTLADAELKNIPKVKSAEYPFVVSLYPSTARITYKGYNETNTYYMDYQADTDTWLPGKSFAQSNTSPAIYHVFDADRLFYIWKGAKDNKLYYATSPKEGQLTATTTLTADFSTKLPVSICTVDDKKFILAYVSENGKIYLSYFTNYNPARWMEESLFPAKANYTLKDIVIPGSHDAGMSVLTATGGQQPGTINECNTLTQTQNIKGQLNEGIRMFDLRVGTFKNDLYTKHSSSDCMEVAIGGGYGEKFDNVLGAIKQFLHDNKKEVVLLTLSHFCEKEAPAKQVADEMISKLGKDIIYAATKPINEAKLSELAGKVIITFEGYARPDKLIDSCSISAKSGAFINFRREYAATNALAKLLLKEKDFFTGMTSGVNNNDLIRLDWQLTQASDEAALICNDFQDERVSPIVNGAMLLTNMLRKNKTIRDLALMGNKSITLKVNEWISNGTINPKNKPNILYVDVAGGWITDYCVELNKSNLYK